MSIFIGDNLRENTGVMKLPQLFLPGISKQTTIISSLSNFHCEVGYFKTKFNYQQN